MDPTRIKVAQNPDHLAELAADILLHQFQDNKDLNICCATGATPVRVYDKVAATIQKKKIPMGHIRCFHLDEYVGLPPQDPRSYAHYMRQHVVLPWGIEDKNAILWDGCASNPQVECQKYEALIQNHGGIDWMILGLGMNGHVAFNEPSSDPHSGCHVIRLAASTLQNNAPYLGGLSPEYGMTMGIGSILRARNILLLVSGGHKSAPLNRLLTGNIDTDFPASHLKQHPDMTIVADAAAMKGVI